MEQRNIVIRILAAVGWFILIYFGSNMLISGVVGGIAGAGVGGAGDFEEIMAATQQATNEFFARYLLIILAGQVGLFALLAYARMLPGTTKYKKNKDLSG
ncbi:MAG: hypothetical protein ACR2PR_00595 [Pseudohongiellaceae bacterium]